MWFRGGFVCSKHFFNSPTAHVVSIPVTDIVYLIERESASIGILCMFHHSVLEIIQSKESSSGTRSPIRTYHCTSVASSLLVSVRPPAAMPPIRSLDLVHRVFNESAFLRGPSWLIPLLSHRGSH